MSIQPRTYKPKANLVADIETLSIDGRAAVVEIAVVALIEMVGFPAKFSVLIKPSEYEKHTQFTVEEDTRNFHDRENPDFLEEAEANGVTILEAATKLYEFVQQYADVYEVHMWSQGKDFDFPILTYMLKECGLKAPWSYGRIHCLRDLVWLNPKTRIQPAPGGIKHRALPDAEFEALQLYTTMKSSTWYQRLFQ